MTLVVDASLVVAALVDGGTTGRWAERVMLSSDLAAPHLMPVEAANILRRAAVAGNLTDETAIAAHGDLLDIGVALFPYAATASRAWELRENLTLYDACYVALAELLDAGLGTLDERLARAPGPRCGFVTPAISAG